MKKDYSREVTLYCPVCGCSQFSCGDETWEGCPEDTVFTCVGCGRGFEKDDLIERNSEVISANVDEVVDEIAADFEKDQTYWALYVDGEYSMVGIRSVKVRSGMKIGLKMEVYQES